MKKKRFSPKEAPFKYKIFLCTAALVLVCLLLFSLVLGQVFVSNAMQRAREGTLREMELINRNLDTLLASAEGYSRIIASDYRLQGELSSYNTVTGANKEITRLRVRTSMSDILSNIIAPNTQIVGVAVFTMDELVYSGYSIPEKSVWDIITPEQLEEVQNAQVPTWTELSTLHYEDRLPANVFSVSKLILGKNTGRRLGVVTLFVNERNVSGIYTKDLSGPNDRYFIADANGHIISSENPEYLFQNIHGALRPFGVQAGKPVQTGDILRAENGEKYLYSSMEYGRFGWHIICLSSLETIASENANMMKIIAAMALLFLLAVFVTSYLLAHTVTKPIQSLSGTMESIIGGDMDVRADESFGAEVGMLAKGFNKLMNRVQELLAEVYMQQKSKRENELKLLQTQIKPHFLYNTMETVSSFIKLDMKDEALATVQDLSRFYKVSLSKGDEIITVSEEMQLVESYLDIQKKRYTEYMDYVLDVDPDILACPIPKLTIQPLVENSIYHGIKPKGEKGCVQVSGRREQGWLRIEVWDNGGGIPAARLEKLRRAPLESGRRESFGLGSVEERLRLLYGSQFSMELESTEGEYTKIVLRIPLQSPG